MIFKRSFLVNDLDLPYGGGEADIIEDNISSKSRWSIHHELIFKYNDKFYRTKYSEAATECQRERPWEYEDNVYCEEVEPYETTVIKYRKVAGE